MDRKSAGGWEKLFFPDKHMWRNSSQLHRVMTTHGAWNKATCNHEQRQYLLRKGEQKEGKNEYSWANQSIHEAWNCPTSRFIILNNKSLIVKPTNYILPKLVSNGYSNCSFNNWNVHHAQQLKFHFPPGGGGGNNHFTKGKASSTPLNKHTLLLGLNFLKPNYFQTVLIAGNLIKKT